MFKHFEWFPRKGVMHLFEVSAPFNKCISFKILKWWNIPIEASHVFVYFYVKNEPSCTCNALFIPFHNMFSYMKNTWYCIYVSTQNMSFTIAQHFSECIMWYSSKTTNHIFKDNQTLFEHMVYCMHVAPSLKEYSRFWRMFCWILWNIPLIWVRYLIKGTQLLLDSIENMSFSESCLNEGWSDQEEEYTCQTKVVQFSKNAASSHEVLFAIQDNMLLFCVKKRKRIL